MTSETGFVDGAAALSSGVQGKKAVKQTTTSANGITASYTPPQPIEGVPKPDEVRKVFSEKCASSNQPVSPDTRKWSERHPKQQVADTFVYGNIRQTYWSKDKAEKNTVVSSLGFAPLAIEKKGKISEAAPKYNVPTQLHGAVPETSIIVDSNASKTGISKKTDLASPSKKQMTEYPIPSVAKVSQANVHNNESLSLSRTTVSTAPASPIVHAPADGKGFASKSAPSSPTVALNVNSVEYKKATAPIATVVNMGTQVSEAKISNSTGTLTHVAAVSPSRAPLISTGAGPDPRKVVGNGVVVHKDLHMSSPVSGKASSSLTPSQKSTSAFVRTVHGYDYDPQTHVGRSSKASTPFAWTAWKSAQNADAKAILTMPFNQLVMAPALPVSSFLFPVKERAAVSHLFSYASDRLSADSALKDGSTGVGLDSERQMPAAIDKAAAGKKALADQEASPEYNDNAFRGFKSGVEGNLPTRDDLVRSEVISQAYAERQQLSLSEKSFTDTFRWDSNQSPVSRMTTELAGIMMYNPAALFEVEGMRRNASKSIPRLTIDRVEQVKESPQAARLKVSDNQKDILGMSLAINFWITPDLHQLLPQQRRGWPHWMIVPLEKWELQKRNQKLPAQRDPALPALETHLQRLLELMPNNPPTSQRCEAFLEEVKKQVMLVNCFDRIFLGEDFMIWRAAVAHVYHRWTSALEKLLEKQVSNLPIDKLADAYYEWSPAIHGMYDALYSLLKLGITKHREEPLGMEKVTSTYRQIRNVVEQSRRVNKAQQTLNAMQKAEVTKHYGYKVQAAVTGQSFSSLLQGRSAAPAA
jgi:hypothetical protein